MTSNKSFILACALLFAVGSSMGQTFRDEIPSGSKLSQKDLQKSVFSAQNLNPLNSSSVSATNSIYIQQIGNNNSLVANTRTVAGRMNVLQAGNRNEVAVDVTSALLDENIIQWGRNNSFIDINGGASLLHRANVLQRGTNQNLIWLGSNSLSEKIRVNMSGQKQTVIIRNIKRQ